MIRSAISLILLSACVSTPGVAQNPANHFDWLTGCWHSEDGSTREVWSQSEDGYYFGYSVVFHEAKAVFFEKMRIDPGETPTFNAYPRGNGPSAFPAIETISEKVTFANDAHDYPQRIQYWRDGDQLRAQISKIDGSDANDFVFAPCGGE